MFAFIGFQVQLLIVQNIKCPLAKTCLRIWIHVELLVLQIIKFSYAKSCLRVLNRFESQWVFAFIWFQLSCWMYKTSCAQKQKLSYLLSKKKLCKNLNRDGVSIYLISWWIVDPCFNLTIFIKWVFACTSLSGCIVDCSIDLYSHLNVNFAKIKYYFQNMIALFNNVYVIRRRLSFPRRNVAVGYM